MATTTNYGWGTPDDTDLVKDGALAIRDLGSDIDSTVFANAGAAIAKTIVDAKGDLISATADDTPARLAVGANDTVLTADSSTATGLKWAAPAAAGGLTLINTTSFSAVSSQSITDVFTSTYDSYRIILKITSSSATGETYARLRVGGADATTNYKSVLSTAAQTNWTSGGVLTLTSTTHLYIGYRHTTTGSSVVTYDLHYPQIATQTHSQGFYNSTGDTAAGNGGFTNGILNNTTQYTSISFIPTSGNITGNVSIYGYNK
jgi:hypothetical protein